MNNTIFHVIEASAALVDQSTEEKREDKEAKEQAKKVSLLHSLKALLLLHC